MKSYSKGTDLVAVVQRVPWLLVQEVVAPGRADAGDGCIVLCARLQHSLLRAVRIRLDAW